jgi:hypothetical protein
VSPHPRPARSASVCARLAGLFSLILGVLLSGPVAAEWIPQVPPAFVRFPATIYRGRPARVDLRSHPTARRFRTVLREGARLGPNFAGHYTLIDWGCGTSCRAFAIVDAKTGGVYFPSFSLDDRPEFRVDSTLLVTDPYEANYPENELIGPRIRTYYAWTGKALLKVGEEALVWRAE